jgi:hypothetical protein
LPRDAKTLGIIAAPSQAVFFRYFCRPVLKFLKSVAARIDVSNFPGSCCG